MDKKTGILMGIIGVAFICLLGGFLLRRNSLPDNIDSVNDGHTLATITEMAKQNNYDGIDLNSIIPAQEMNGNLPENIIGNRNAPVVIYEYADYQCSYCAGMSPYLKSIVEDFDGKVAIAFRTYVLPYHSNGVPVASAVEAAAIQGYWSEYKDLVFANQSDWYYDSGEALQQKLEEYFVKVAGDRADLEKFRADMTSEAVAKKLAFDMGAGSKMDIGGTPWLYLDGKWIENDNLSPANYAEKIRETINEKLKKLEESK